MKTLLPYQGSRLENITPAYYQMTKLTATVNARLFKCLHISHDEHGETTMKRKKKKKKKA